MNTKRSIFRSARRRSAHNAKAPPRLRDQFVNRGAWYPDPFGVAGERWWDGGKWTQQVQGKAPGPAQVTVVPGQVGGFEEGVADTHSSGRSPGWYRWDRDWERYWDGQRWSANRYWDGQQWDAARAPRLPEVDPRQYESPGVRWLIRGGYAAALLFPALGLVLGIILATRPTMIPWKRQGIQITVLALLSLALGLLLFRHR
jgi:hypothetical protein